MDEGRKGRIAFIVQRSPELMRFLRGTDAHKASGGICGDEGAAWDERACLLHFGANGGCGGANKVHDLCLRRIGWWHGKGLPPLKRVVEINPVSADGPIARVRAGRILCR